MCLPTVALCEVISFKQDTTLQCREISSREQGYNLGSGFGKLRGGGCRLLYRCTSTAKHASFSFCWALCAPLYYLGASNCAKTLITLSDPFRIKAVPTSAKVPSTHAPDTKQHSSAHVQSTPVIGHSPLPTPLISAMSRGQTVGAKRSFGISVLQKLPRRAKLTSPPVFVRRLLERTPKRREGQRDGIEPPDRRARRIKSGAPRLPMAS